MLFIDSLSELKIEIFGIEIENPLFNSSKVKMPYHNYIVKALVNKFVDYHTHKGLIFRTLNESYLFRNCKCIPKEFHNEFGKYVDTGFVVEFSKTETGYTVKTTEKETTPESLNKLKASILQRGKELIPIFEYPYQKEV